jgi:hypothetical protein
MTGAEGARRVSAIGTGAACPVTTVGKDEAETEKRLDAALLNDFGREPVPFVAALLHPPWLLNRQRTRKLNCRDKAMGTLGEDALEQTRLEPYPS